MTGPIETRSASQSLRVAANRWILVVAACTGGATFMSSERIDAADKPAKVLRHVVLYEFKPDLPPQQLQEVVDAFAGLPKKIDAIVGFEHGVNVSPEGKSDGLTHCFVVTFRDEKGRDAYLVHPAHLAYVNVVKDRRKRVVVFDYWAAP